MWLLKCHNYTTYYHVALKFHTMGKNYKKCKILQFHISTQKCEVFIINPSDADTGSFQENWIDTMPVMSWLLNSLRPSDAYMRRWSNHHWFRQWLVAWSAPNHYLNQCWDIVNWTLRNKLQWNFNQNTNIFIQKNAFENIVCETVAILFRPQCVKIAMPSAEEGHACVVYSATAWGRVMYVCGSGNGQGPVLLLPHDAVARILGNGSAAFIESCAAIG